MEKWTETLLKQLLQNTAFSIQYKPIKKCADEEVFAGEKELLRFWIFNLKLMINYFSGFGNTKTTDSELNYSLSKAREKLREYEAKRFPD